MGNFRWALPLAQVFLALSANAAALPKDVLPLSIVDNRVFVDVKINGQGPFSFLIDTGSSSTTISPGLARHLQLGTAGAGNGGGAGEQKVSFDIFHVASMSVGNTLIGPLDAPAIDLTKVASVVGFQRCDGVLGTEIFQHHVVTIDAANAQFVVESDATFTPSRNATAVPFTLEDNDLAGMPIVTGSVNGIPASFEIDTGDRSSLTLFGPFWAANHLDRAIGPTVRAMTGYGVGGPIRSIVGRPHDVTVAGIRFPPPVTRLSLQKAGSFTRTTYAGSIGMGILNRFSVSFDYTHKTMWLQKSHLFDVPDQYDRSGIWLGLTNDGGISAIDVTENGPAAKAGMSIGDRIVDVNGTPANPQTLFTIRALLRKPGLATAIIRTTKGDKLSSHRISLQNQID